MRLLRSDPFAWLRRCARIGLDASVPRKTAKRVILYERLRGTFSFGESRLLQVKGKGELRAYFLGGRRGAVGERRRRSCRPCSFRRGASRCRAPC
jgi:hypothetical protein